MDSMSKLCFTRFVSFFLQAMFLFSNESWWKDKMMYSKTLQQMKVICDP